MTFSWLQSIINVFFLNHSLCFKSLLSAGWAHVVTEILQCAKYYYRTKIKSNRINNKGKRVGKVTKKVESSLKYQSSQVVRIQGMDFDIFP